MKLIVRPHRSEIPPQNQEKDSGQSVVEVMAFKCLLNRCMLPGIRHPILSQAGLMASFPGPELESDQLPGWAAVGQTGGSLLGAGRLLFFSPIGRKN